MASPTTRAALAASLGFAALLPLTTPSAAEDTAPAAAPLGQITLDDNAIFFESYEGIVNNNSFQQSGILTHDGYQYAAWWTESRHPVLARRPVDSGPGRGNGPPATNPGNGNQRDQWETIQLDHQLTQDDSHNVISLGISENDGRLHVAMDTHNTPVFYTRSAAGLADGDTAWDTDSFAPIERDLGGVDTGEMTYPRFVPTPDGDLQFGYRTGGSGDGTLNLAEYADGAWSELGAWTSPEGEYEANGAVSDTRNMYLHGIGYDADGRLHASFTWREDAEGGDILCDPGGLSNHDTGYVYSDDAGRSWHTDDGQTAAVTGTDRRVSVDTPNHVVDPLEPNYALMNQESQAVDSSGDPHVMISYRPGRFGDCSTDFVADREDEGRAFHLHRDTEGSWHKVELPEPIDAFGRTQLVLTEGDTAYAVMPHGRILAATAESGWRDWSMVHDGADIDSFGEVLVDESRVADEGVLSILYQEPGGDSASSPIHVADFQLG